LSEPGHFRQRFSRHCGTRRRRCAALAQTVLVLIGKISTWKTWP